MFVSLLLFLIRKVCIWYPSDIRPCASSLIFLSSVPFFWVLLLSILSMVPSILKERQPRCLSFWWNFWFRLVWSRSSEVLFCYFFYHLRLFDSVRFQYSQLLEIFLFFISSNFSCFSSAIISVICLFSLFIMRMPHFSISNSNSISRLYILTFCISLQFCF